MNQFSQKIIAVDSTYRTSGSQSSFSTNVDLSQPNNFNRCSLLSGQVVKSWNDVDLQFDTFQFVEGAELANLSLDVGVYTTEEIAEKMAEIMTFQSSIGGWASATYTAKVSDRNVIQISSNGTIKFDLQILQRTYSNGIVNPMINYFGFPNGIPVQSSVFDDDDEVEVLTFPRPSLMQRYGAIQIRMREARNSNDAVLYTILASVAVGDSMYVENRSPLQSSVAFQNSSQNSLSFQITDILGNEIPMQSDSQLIISLWENKM